MSSPPKSNLYDEIGGRLTLERVHKIFYDKVYAHAWLRKYFEHIDQQHIENQQSDFMSGAMGGPKVYCGRLPVPAHEHMFITDELFDARTTLLEASLVEAGLTADAAARWLKIDRAFQGSLVKSDVSECKKRYFTDEILAFPKPRMP
jgi:hemoglobin